MATVLHYLYVIFLLLLLVIMFLKDSTCGVCFIGVLLINARLNENYVDK